MSTVLYAISFLPVSLDLAFPTIHESHSKVRRQRDGWRHVVRFRASKQTTRTDPSRCRGLEEATRRARSACMQTAASGRGGGARGNVHRRVGVRYGRCVRDAGGHPSPRHRPPAGRPCSVASATGAPPLPCPCMRPCIQRTECHRRRRAPVWALLAPSVAAGRRVALAGTAPRSCWHLGRRGSISRRRAQSMGMDARSGHRPGPPAHVTRHHAVTGGSCPSVREREPQLLRLRRWPDGRGRGWLSSDDAHQ